MTKVVSLINLKGGVAKTTTTIQLAECLVSVHKQKVLVIDLDPQTNATISLIPEERWEELDNQGKTIYQLFADKLKKDDEPDKFNIKSAIQSRDISSLRLSNLHLLASSLNLINIQDDLREISVKTSIKAEEVLKTAIQPVLHQYDYVLIDCPPNLGLITLNGIEVSDYYLIPTIADTLSTHGIPQVISQITKKARGRNLKIKCMGLVITKYDGKGVQRDKIEKLKSNLENTFDFHGLPRADIFKTKMPQVNATANAMDYDGMLGINTFSKKYGYGNAGYQPTTLPK